MAGVDVTDYFYPVDVTGFLPTNKVPPEGHTINPPESVPNQINYNFMIPFAGPYYRDSIKMTHVSSGRVLQRGIDWMPGHKFLSASMETEQVRGGIYLSVLFLDQTLAGQVMITEYQTLGGSWALDENKIFEIMANRAIDPRSVSYDEVAEKPEVFPPVDHQHASADFIGMTEAVLGMLGISTAIREQTNSYLQNPPVMFGLYYKRSEIDAQQVAVAQKFNQYYDAPTIDQKLADLVLGSGGNDTDTYTKAQINVLFQGVNTKFNSHYTTAQIDTTINGINARLDQAVLQSQLPDIEDTVTNAVLQRSDASVQQVINTLGAAFDDGAVLLNS